MNARRRRSSAAASQRAPPTEPASPPRAARHGCTETPPGTRSEGAARRHSGPLPSPPRVPACACAEGSAVRRPGSLRGGRREGARGAAGKRGRDGVLSGCHGEGKETTRLTIAPSWLTFLPSCYVQRFLLSLLSGLRVFSPSPAGFWLFTAVPNVLAPCFPCQPTTLQLSPVASHCHCLPSTVPESHPRRKGQL